MDMTIISSWDNIEIDATLNRNLSAEETFNVMLINPSKRNVNTIVSRLQQHQHCRIKILVSHRSFFGSHFLEIRNDIQKNISDRHLPKISHCDNVCQILANTTKSKVLAISINLLTYDRRNDDGLKVQIGGIAIPETTNLNHSFLQIRTSKNVMSSAKHIPTCPLPGHKMQQRQSLIRIKHNTKYTETRTYLLHELSDSDTETVQIWIRNLQKQHESLDEEEEADELFQHIWYDSSCHEHKLHQITFCEAM